MPARGRDALAERLLEGVLGAIDVHMVYLGDRLGLYRELAKKRFQKSSGRCRVS